MIQSENPKVRFYFYLDIFDNISYQLFCEPIVAEIKIVNNQLEVPLGQKQGLRVNQLAVLEDNGANSVTMLSISKLDNNRATLLPLNSKFDFKVQKLSKQY